ncbi:hypothetical protein OG800_48830 [Streptomyces sp. NBC_00445]|uniref:hypothetical protein n=1 Tax=Streptomyces sp. NBC_00445 TaxID=2975745 RepID=UPI002E1FEA06
MARTSRIALFVMALLGVTVLSTPGNAVAVPAPTAYNTYTQFLTHEPRNGMPESCTQRRIYLAVGEYRWGGEMKPVASGAAARGLFVDAGWYTWRDCLDPKHKYYSHKTSLAPEDSSDSGHTYGFEWRLPFSGTYTWGSSLEPVDIDP